MSFDIWIKASYDSLVHFSELHTVDVALFRKSRGCPLTITPSPYSSRWKPYSEGGIDNFMMINMSEHFNKVAIIIIIPIIIIIRMMSQTSEHYVIYHDYYYHYTSGAGHGGNAAKPRTAASSRVER